MKDTNTSCQAVTPSSLEFGPFRTDRKEVLFTPELSSEEKREVLSSGEADARAAIGAPTQRRLDKGPIPGHHESLDAPKKQDDASAEPCRPNLEYFTRHGRRGSSRDWLHAILRLNRRDDDDDDPPPCPVAISPSPRLPPFGAEIALEAA